MLIAVRDSADKLNRFVKEAPALPGDDVFKGIATRTEALVGLVPKQIDQKYGKYHNYQCATMLNQEILQLAGVLAGQLDQYRQAANLVVLLLARGQSSPEDVAWFGQVHVYALD